MNERVVFGQKNAKSRVRMVPAYDPVLRVLPILYFVNVFPRILRKGDVGTSLFRIHAFNRSLNFY